MPARDDVPDWYYRDNGFASRRAMDDLHAPIVRMARQRLAENPGPIIDLGCGNGVLLDAVRRGIPDAIPYGIEVDRAKVAHARELFPAFGHNIVEGDLFESTAWPAIDCFRLALLMIGRLSEVPPARAERLLMHVRARCDDLLVYVYPDRGAAPLVELARRVGLRLREGVDTVGVAAR